MHAIQVSHFSDLLCVWAYVAQIRFDELQTEFAEQIDLQYHLFPVFGHAAKKIDRQWENRGGRFGYAKHVRHVVKQFGHVPLHEDIWVNDTPESSLPSHLYLSAIKLLEKRQQLPGGCFEQMAWAFRQAFFAECQNIAKTPVLNQLLEQHQLPVDGILQCIHQGEAYAILSEDMKKATDLNIKASPTLVFNDDRQRLTGNVGYRIIEANVRELLNTPADQNSWC